MFDMPKCTYFRFGPRTNERLFSVFRSERNSSWITNDAKPAMSKAYNFISDKNNYLENKFHQALNHENTQQLPAKYVLGLCRPII